MVALAQERGIPVEERPVRYGELIDWVAQDEVVTICSIGTAGILNRVQTLYLVDSECHPIAELKSDPSHPLYEALAQIRSDYWELFKGNVRAPSTLRLETYSL